VRAGSAAERAIAQALDQVCATLAERIASDGEGARKLLVVRVTGARSAEQARRMARTVASSPLVKTALHGGDPNWGRVFAAAGRAGVASDPDQWELRIGGHVVARRGAAHGAGEAPAARHLRGRRIEMELRVGRGSSEGTALGCDLSADYVAINAHYRT
jgi:glutamate N-acetyltransferase/amino-acid N-acetyltransferase